MFKLRAFKLENINLLAKTTTHNELILTTENKLEVDVSKFHTNLAKS